MLRNSDRTDSATYTSDGDQPTDHQNPIPEGRYNLVIIGAGTAGLVTATAAAALGARVALIEKQRIGGDHLESTLPRMALIEAARLMAQAKRAREFGVESRSEPELNWGVAAARARRMQAESAASESIAQLTSKGIDIYLGEARFVDGGHVAVANSVLSFARALIATGSSPTPPAIPGIENVKPLTVEKLLSSAVPPQRAAIFGATAHGCEWAQVLARFGSRAIVYETGTRILADEDESAALVVQKALEREGVVFRFGCTNMSVNGSKLAGYVLGGECEDEFDEIIITGRRVPNIGTLELEAAHVECDEQGIIVNDRLRTTNARIFAAGDVCSRFRFVHASDALARTVVANALFFGTYKFTAANIPSLTMTDPEIARVGCSEQDEGVKQYHRMELDFHDVDRALLGGEDGLVRLYYDRRGGIHGATVVASRAGEMIGEIALAMRHTVRLSSLAADLHPYPTFSEVFKRAGDLYRHSLLTPTVAKMLKKLLKWRR